MGAFPSVARLSQFVKEEYLDVEYDTVKKWATVYMYSRAVESLANLGNGSSGCDGGGVAIHHWALVVHFDDESYRILEGNRNEDGFLHAYYKEYRPNGTEKLRKLGKVFISPAKLRAIARDNERNGRCYDVVDNNCQDWAFRAAMDISKDVGMEASRIPAVTPILSVARHLLGWDVIRMFLLGFKPAERIMPGRC